MYQKETLEWIEVQLQAAKEAGVSLLPVVHHNVLQQHAMLSKGYTLDNAADLKALFDQYGIHFGFSGHTHSQNIVKEDLGQVNYTEVVNGAFSIYPAIIGQLSLDDTSIHYQKLNLIWLRGQKSTNLVIQICRITLPTYKLSLTIPVTSWSTMC